MLDPNARPFIPATRLIHAADYSKDNEEAGGVGLLDLPLEVLARILEMAVRHSSQVAGLLRVCKTLKELLKQCAFRVRLPYVHDHEACLRRSRSILLSLQSLCPALIELHLGGLPLEDQDVERLMAAFPILRVLCLDGCRKLSSATAEVIHCGNTSNSGSKLQLLDLQRCFQLEGNSLTAVLARSSGTPLRGALLSHLNLDRLPREGPSLLLTPGNLQILALTNCCLVTSAALEAITLCCPSLQMLMLGGISVADTTSSTSAEDLMKELQLQDVDDGSSLLSAATAAVHAVSEAHPDSQLAKLLRVQAFAMQLCLTAVQLPLLRVIEVTSMARGIIASVKLFLKEHAEQHRNKDLSLFHTPEMWDFSETSSLVAALAMHKGQVILPGVPGGWSASDTERSLAVKLAIRASACSSNAARRTALAIAAEQGNAENARLLVSLGAVVDCRDRGGATPLFRACFFGHYEVAKLLVAAGADVQQENSAYETPLYIAALRGHVEVMKYLLNIYKQRNLRWQEASSFEAGWTPLLAAMVAPGPSHLLNAAALLGAAAQCAAPGPGPRSPVMSPARRYGRHVKCASEGNCAAAMVVAPNRFGQAALHLAARRGDCDLLHLLLQPLGNKQVRPALNQSDMNGATPLSIAGQFGHQQAMALLVDASRC